LRYYDIHAHLADGRLTTRLAEVLAESRRHGVAGVLAAAARASEWDTIAALSRHEGVFGALGVHPFFPEQWDAGCAGRLRAAVRACPGIRAVGEIGLDFYDGRGSEARQREVFEEQLRLARELGLAVILHNRKAWPEFFETVRRLRLTPLRGVCHHFSATIEVARQALDCGLHLSFCGPVTYPHSRRLREAARYVPSDRLLTETDAPDLPPWGHRGELSLPWHVAEVLGTLAELRGTPEEELAAQVEANFREVTAAPEAGADSTWQIANSR